MVDERSEDIVKVDKSSWPRTSEGTIDWEVVFEDPKNGLIPAVSVAKKPDTLIDCAAIITEVLFSRANDEDIRANYTGQLASIAINNSDASVEDLLEHVSTFLRDIKDDRIQRAADWIIHKAQRNAASAMMEIEDGESGGIPREDRDETEVLFEDLFCDAVDQRYQVLWAGVTQKPMNERKLPFFVAADFALRIQAVVRKEFMPIIIPKCRHIIAMAQRAHPEVRDEDLRMRMADEQTRRELWEVWKATWRQVMQEPPLPKKPDSGKKGVLNSFVKAVQAIGETEQEYTIEDWEEDVETTKMQQAMVRDIWEYVMAPSDVFEPPLEEDKLLLMNMFGKTPGGLRDQIAALRQMAQQSDNAGRAFDTYAKGKDLQLALIAVSHQHPDLFLEGDMVLKNMLRGVPKKARELDFPLVVRYLKEFI